MRHVMPVILSSLLVGTAIAAELPAPLVELRCSGDLRNQGTLGGEATLQEYAPGEGARYVPGPWGLCLSFSDASRSGGSSREPAGGAAVFADERLGGLQQMTLSAWFRPLDRGAPARLLYMPG